MKPKDIDRFFRTLSKRWPHPTRIILVGGGYALLKGGARTTEDLDFEVETEDLASFSEVLKEVANETGIRPQFSEDIDHWSQITLLDYRQQSRLYKKFRKIRVYLPTVIHWGIGKITRYLDQDASDLRAVFKKVKPDPKKVARIWRSAIERSPRSNVLFQAKKNALAFFSIHGKDIWGKKLNLEEIKKILD